MKRRLLAGVLVAAALLTAGCASSSSESAASSAAPTAAPATTGAQVSARTTTAATTTSTPPATTVAPSADSGGHPTVRAIVSLSPSATEMLFAIGAGDQVIAVDDLSNYPPEAFQKPHDLSALQPSVEAIARLHPDLVVIGGDFTGLTEQLAAVHVDVYNGPAATTFEDIYRQIEELGALTGHTAQAAAVVDRVRAGIAAAVARAPKFERPLTYYHELDDTYYSITSNAFIGQVYGLFGLRSIADISEGTNDYPQLSAEAIVSADPDIIFLADSKCCQQDATSVSRRDGWSKIAAVADGNVFTMDDDLASRWGPRIVDYVQSVADALAEVKVPVG
jgi:iron complex transport system substrate-binding protein